MLAKDTWGPASATALPDARLRSGDRATMFYTKFSVSTDPELKPPKICSVLNIINIGL